MARTIQRGLFTTYRGKLVKRSMITLVIVSVGLTVATNATRGSEPEVVDVAVAAMPADYGMAADPVVTSSVANPFSAESASFYQVGEAQGPEDSGELDLTELGMEPEPSVTPQVSESVEIRQVAQTFAAPWATYTQSQDVAGYVGTLPGLAPSAIESFTSVTSDGWAERFAPAGAFIGTLSGETPIVRSHDSVAGTARVDVSVAQEAVGSIDAQSIKPIVVQVDLIRYEEDGALKWGVSAARAI